MVAIGLSAKNAYSKTALAGPKSRHDPQTRIGDLGKPPANVGPHAASVIGSPPGVSASAIAGARYFRDCLAVDAQTLRQLALGLARMPMVHNSIMLNTSKLLLAIGALAHESNRESSEPVYEAHERLPHRPVGGIT